MRFRVTALVVATAIVAACASPAQASTFTAQVRNNANGTTTFKSESFPVETGDVPFPSNFGYPNAFIGSAAAGRGVLRVSAKAKIPDIGHYSHGVDGGSRASVTFDDFFVTGPAGATSVDYRSVLDVDGFVFTSHPPGYGSADASFTLSFELPGGHIDTGTISDNSGIISGTGLFTGSTGAIPRQRFTSGISTFSTIVPNTFTISIIAGAGAGAGSSDVPGQFAEANSFFSNTVSFPTSGPVFDLPEGFTVNSVSANIVDNHWVGEVPEPATFALLASAFLTIGRIGFLRRRRRATQ